MAEITDLPGKFKADQFILQVAMQAMLINLEGKLGAQMYRILRLKGYAQGCLLYTSPSPRDLSTSRMPSSA